MPTKKVVSMRHAFILQLDELTNKILIITINYIASCCYGHENGFLMQEMSNDFDKESGVVCCQSSTGY